MNNTSIADGVRDARLEMEAWKAEMIPEAQVYGGDRLPPGTTAVDERLLEGKSFPDVNAKRGVPPLADVTADGRVVADELFDDWGSPRFPFRFPWYSRAYGVWLARDAMSAIVRNISPIELAHGMNAVVSYNESRDWAAVLGRVSAVRTDRFVLATAGGEEVVKVADVQFVGKIVGYWQTGEGRP